MNLLGAAGGDLYFGREFSCSAENILDAGMTAADR